jgi:hypothetical protein
MFWWGNLISAIVLFLKPKTTMPTTSRSCLYWHFVVCVDVHLPLVYLMSTKI